MEEEQNTKLSPFLQGLSFETKILIFMFENEL